MNAKNLLSLLFAGALACACAKPCSVRWTEGPTDPDTGKTVHQMDILNPPAGVDWTLWFCQFRTPVTLEPEAPATIEHIAGTLYRVVPTVDTKGGTMTLRYAARALVNRGRAPEAFYLQKKGQKPVPIDLETVFLPADPVRSFSYTPVETSAYDMVPRLKKVTPGEGAADLAGLADPEPEYVPAAMPGWYRITVGDALKVEASDEDGAFWASVTLANLRRNAGGEPVPAAVIEDWPDLPYRGLMLDVSRNFTKKEDVEKLLDIMSHYKLNHLHFHLGDDEGWRVEIDGLPELTSYGAFRGIPEVREDGSFDEKDALMPAYSGTLDRNDAASPGNGYYSKDDYVEILRYAWERRIRVIPEFDTPGHSRAAIKAMDYRARTTGDRTYLLSEPEDTSRYLSAQDYTDNALNVAFPSTYAFLDKVFDGIIALYREAGVPLEAVHVGGDEVPEGAWEGSPACRALMQEQGLTDIAALKEYFINRVLDIAEAKGVQVAGWQEVAQHLSPATFERLKKDLFFANLWTVSHGRDVLAYEFANEGVPVVLSNAPNYYFDFAYNDSKLERGHSWGGLVDERRCFSFLPYDVYRSVRWDDHRKIRDISRDGEGKTALTPEGRPYILGVQGQLWSETIRSFDHVTYYLFPKSVGLAERGWNAEPAWSGTTVADDPAFLEDFDRFFSIVVDHEYPYYKGLGISWHRN
ncbi:MAG: family 20 glycosylhydrolase [Bacteroidales bacterium]|nr:family 20 glycosylhydrolase [Bacteroidales bacterium]